MKCLIQKGSDLRSSLERLVRRIGTLVSPRVCLRAGQQPLDDAGLYQFATVTCQKVAVAQQLHERAERLHRGDQRGTRSRQRITQIGLYFLL